MSEYLKFTQQNIPVDRVYSLSKLVSACKKNDIEIEKVNFYQNGFQVVFKGMSGDAILHDNSYGNMNGKWETIGFPWDYDDVSIHAPKQLAKMLGALKTNSDWEQFEGD